MELRRRLLWLAAVPLVALAACGGDGEAAGATAGACPGDPVVVVVSVSQWGDIVEELGGDCAEVTTIVSGSSVDPHEFEPSPADLAAFDDAQLVVVNGLDYDPWASDAVDAVASSLPTIDAGEIAGRAQGDNPHLWYDPSAVRAVADAVTRELRALSPPARPYFDARHVEWTASMTPYLDEVSRLAGEIDGHVTYAATEPVFEYMADALTLVDRTPAGYAQAAATETDPAPGDINALVDVLEDGADLLIVNPQTEGAITAQIREAGEKAGVPIVDITESPPSSSSFVSWQLDQLAALAAALERS
jgi:zinc/manganese transport system substrate-binding protein